MCRSQGWWSAGAFVMEIYCPTCREGYRIPTAPVPKTSRMVVCNSCGTAWKQFFDKKPKLLDRDSAQKVSDVAAVRRPSYSQAGLKILREEVANGPFFCLLDNSVPTYDKLVDLRN